MPFHFCPQCGTKLQPGFRFCPSCGEKLPSSASEAEVEHSVASLSLVTPKKAEDALSSVNSQPTETQPITCPLITPRPALRKCRVSLRLDKAVKFNIKEASTNPDETEDGSVGSTGTSPKPPAESSPAEKSLRRVSLKARVTNPFKRPLEESAVDGSPVATSPPTSSPTSRPPVKGKGKAKKVKLAFTVEPLQDGEEVTDMTGKKWKLVKLLSQSATELVYEVLQIAPRSKDSNHILKLGAKDGRIFNEQNFLQRAAKPASVDKWIKQHKMDFLGIPSCAGFGLHADSYRFLIFPSMGESLQSVMEEKQELLSEKAVLQLACRILDVLQYIHSNEYIHADINAENVYIRAGDRSQVYLVGYCHAFRYCPGGQHVEYREDSRTPHEGNIDSISLDAHKGAGPSRRSDLQSLGYCMLRWHTGALPWDGLSRPDEVTKQKQRYMEDVSGLLGHCFGRKRVSSAFQAYLTAVMALQYSEQPDYSALKDQLTAALLQLGGSAEQPLDF